MLVTFRQGIVRLQTSPNFLTFTGGRVNLNANTDPTVVTFADGNTDYLYTESESVFPAWTGPFSTGTDYHLYWDIDRTTGRRTFRSTTIAPTFGTTRPSSPAVDQHFFDTSVNKMVVWSGTRWAEKLRVFAGVLVNGSRLAPATVGTQIKLNQQRNIGHILFDGSGNPVKTGTGEFVTSETLVSPSDNLPNDYKLESLQVRARAIESIPKFHAVTWKSTNRLGLASYLRPDEGFAVGISAEDMTKDEIRAFIKEGLVINEFWDFSEDPGTLLFVGASGEVTTTVPQTGSMQVIGHVVDRNTAYINIREVFKIDAPLVTPTPTVTVSVTPPVSPPVSTVTPTPTMTVTPTVTATQTVTPTPSTSVAVTPTVTPTITTTVTPTLTPTVTPSPSEPESFESVMTGLNPFVWYRFDEASGNVIDYGNDAANLDLDTDWQGGLTYGFDGPSAAADSSPHSVALAFGGRYSSVDGFSNLNGDNPSATGTFMYVFRTHGQLSDNTRFMGGPTSGSDDHYIGLAFTGVNMSIWMQNGPTGADTYAQTYNESTLEAVSSSPFDGNWHMVVWVQTGAGHTVYYDGQLLGTPDSTNNGANISSDYWVDDIPLNNDRFLVGALDIFNTFPDWFFHGNIDEIAYWDGVQLTGADVTDLWTPLAANVSGRDAFENLGHALRQVSGGGPNHVVNMPGGLSSQINDGGNASVQFSGLTSNGSILTYREPSFDIREITYSLNPSSYITGASIVTGDISTSDMANDTSGWFHFMLRVEDATHTWNPDLMNLGNNNVTVEPGDLRVKLNIFSGTIGQFTVRGFNGLANEAFSVDVATEFGGAVDLLDGNWHQIIVYQPADGTGMDMWFDGNMVTDVTGGGFGYGVNMWWNDLFTDNSSPRWTFGAYGSSSDFGLDGQLDYIVFHNGAMNDALAQRLWAATGL